MDKIAKKTEKQEVENEKTKSKVSENQLNSLLAGLSENYDNTSLNQDDKWKNTKFYQVCLL